MSLIFIDPCDTYVCKKPYSVCELDDESPICTCPETCSNTSEPVCGSDDQTYLNLCMLRKRSCEKNKLITVAEKGACSKSILIQFIKKSLPLNYTTISGIKILIDIFTFNSFQNVN